MRKKFKYIFGFIAMATFLLVTSCEDDDLAPEVNVSGKSVEAAFPGDPVSITGTNFNTVQFVFVGDKQTAFELNGDNVSFIVPDDARVGNNQITFAMQDNYRVQFPFEVLLRPIPVIQEFDAFVPIGGDLVITGTSFNPEYDLTVTIDGVEAAISSQTNTELIVTVPGGIPDDEALEIEISSIHGSSTTKTAFIARENLLSNSQLSEGSGDEFTGWSKLNGGDRMTAVTGAEAYGGGRSMMVMPASGNPWDNQFGADGVQLINGEEYTLVLWAKAIDDDAFMRFSISQYDGAGADYFYGDNAELTNNWTPYSWTFTVGKELPEHVAVLDMGASTGAFMIDHIALMPGAVGISGGSEAPDLLSDGGFEASTLAGTEAGDWEAANGDITLTTSDVYCGNQAVVAVGAGGNAWDTQLIADGVVLEEGTQYELSLWAKSTAPDGEISMSVSRYLGGNGDDYFYSSTVTVAEDWTNYSWVFTAGTTSTGDHNIVLDLGRSAVTYYIDEVNLREYNPENNILPDGSFEATTLAGTDADDWEAANGDITLTTTEVYEGSQAVVAVGAGGNAWDTQLIADGVELEVGKNYRLGLWAKATAPDGEISMSVSRYLGGNGDDYFYSGITTIAEDWTYYSWTFTAGTTSTGDHNIVLDLGRSAITYHIDAVVLSEVPDCE